MKEQYVITISHQLGCGGAYIGKKLSEALSIPFIDRQILKKVADYLEVPETDIEDREERASSFWETFFRVETLGEPLMAFANEYIPSDRELYDLEMKFIEEIAGKGSCIILGRGGRYILKDYPRHFSVFVHADMKDRVQRVCELFQVTEKESQSMIEKNDMERNAYIKTYTHIELLDAETYDICMNTSSIGLDNSVAIIKDALEFKLENC